MEVFTIGFTQRSARDFFGALKSAGVRRLLDVRLHNTSQLAAFAKRDDLAYFTGEILGAAYEHEPRLAPSPALFDAYRKQHGAWDAYVQGYLTLLTERQIEQVIDRRSFDIPTVLLCSERSAERCHRRLALEYLRGHWHDLEIVHL